MFKHFRRRRPDVSPPPELRPVTYDRLLALYDEFATAALAEPSPRAATDDTDRRLGLDPVLATIPGTAAYGVRLGRQVAIGDAVPGDLTDRARRFLDAELDDRLLDLHPDPAGGYVVRSAQYQVIVARDAPDDQVAAIEAMGFAVRRHRYALSGFAVILDIKELREPPPLLFQSPAFRDIAPLHLPRELVTIYALPPTLGEPLNVCQF